MSKQYTVLPSKSHLITDISLIMRLFSVDNATKLHYVRGLEINKLQIYKIRSFFEISLFDSV